MADNDHHSIDSSTGHGHVSAADAKRGACEQALGRSRGGFTCKVHCIADAQGRPLDFHLTPGEAADSKSDDALMSLPHAAPSALLADKGYDSDAICGELIARGIELVIPGRRNRKEPICYSRQLYRLRNRIERMFGRIKINRAIAMRYDKLASSFLGTLHLASIKRWLNPSCFCL